MKSAINVSEKRGLSRGEAADYIGVGTSTFDRMVADGLMPQPLQVYGRNVWSRREIDRRFDDIVARAMPTTAPAEDDGWGIKR